MLKWLNENVTWRFMSLERASGRTRRVYDKRRREGREPGKDCIKCGQPVDDLRFKNCNKCREAGRKIYARLRGERMAEGSCLNCGGAREDEALVNCERCRKAQCKRQAVYNARWGDKANMAPAA